ncbi:GntR family transcriptional regulator [Arthrobacter sp. VKM Ac-2550]|uniref:GntR family transcriptional regulator n=1 Tax=Crystallibacter permensis TaxID=1938888 RepID=UPI00222662B4|nr:GntR family transcriptional regulator [Arthrobacter sp. VKM Ac-2550]MCW2131328.1 transcriptional regulator, GntR family [Arthrobacter sp. VKM Ac-2550]
MGKSEEVYASLVRMIEKGELEAGGLVSESGLMERTGFGRTPVREAVQRLARDHMVRIHPSKGIEIPAISVEDQLKRLEVRRVMEVLAVTLACERSTSKEAEVMSALAATLDGHHALDEYSETVRRTHELITASARNDYLAEAMAPLQGLSRRFWLTHVLDEQHEIAVGSVHHRHILEAISARDISKARESSIALNDYLVEFALSVINSRAPRQAARTI